MTLRISPFKDTDANTIDVFYVPAINDGGHGVSYRKGRNQTGSSAYSNWVVVDTVSSGGGSPNTLAHEVMHILLDSAHRDGEPPTALFLGGTTPSKAVDGTKRIGPYPGATNAGIGTGDTALIRTYAETLP